jgi:hypothetical protein
VHSLKFKSAYLLISSPQGERRKVREIYFQPTLTLTLSRQRERGNYLFSSSDLHYHGSCLAMASLEEIRCALLNLK